MFTLILILFLGFFFDNIFKGNKMFVDNTSSSTNESVSDFIEKSNGSYVLLLSSIIRLEQLWIFILHSFLWAFATRFKANVLICLCQSETVERVNLDLLIKSDATLDFELHMSFLVFELNSEYKTEILPEIIECVLQTYFRISQQPIFNLYLIF